MGICIGIYGACGITCLRIASYQQHSPHAQVKAVWCEAAWQSSPAKSPQLLLCGFALAYDDFYCKTFMFCPSNW